MLFSSVETTSISDIAFKNSATSPLSNPNPNPNPIPTSAAFPLPCAEDPQLRRSTTLGAVGPPRAKTKNPANSDFLSSHNTWKAPPTTVQNLTSRISKLKKMFMDEIATYTAITAGILSQYFFLYRKIRQLQPGISDTINCKIPSVKFVLDSAKVVRPTSDPLLEPATSFSSSIFGTNPHAYNIFAKFYPYGIGAATGKCASTLFTLFHGDYDNLLQWRFSKLIHIGIRDQFDPLNTWTKTIKLDQDPAYRKLIISTKTGVSTVIFDSFIPHSKLFSETEGFLIDSASYIEIKFSDTPVLKPHKQTSLLFPFP